MSNSVGFCHKTDLTEDSPPEGGFARDDINSEDLFRSGTLLRRLNCEETVNDILRDSSRGQFGTVTEKVSRSQGFFLDYDWETETAAGAARARARASVAEAVAFAALGPGARAAGGGGGWGGTVTSGAGTAAVGAGLRVLGLAPTLKSCTYENALLKAWDKGLKFLRIVSRALEVPEFTNEEGARLFDGGGPLTSYELPGEPGIVERIKSENQKRWDDAQISLTILGMEG